VTIAVIDGDIVAFRAAAANESRSIKATHKETGVTTEHAHRTALKEHIKGVFDLDEFDIEDVQEPGDIRHALHAARTTIEGVCKTCAAESFEIYLSGDNNFRLDLPLPTRYKSNRDNTYRPSQLPIVREYLLNKYNAKLVHGREADDMLAQRSYEGIKNKQKIIQVTIDKDAYGYSGWLYNWTKMNEPMLIKGLGEIQMEDKKLKGFGRKWFYAQWVMGDSTDGFRPADLSGKKFGDASAYKLLKDCTTDKECVEAVYKQYKSWYPSELEYMDWSGSTNVTDVIGLMDMYAACAHMKRFDADVFNTRKLLDNLEIDY